MRDDVFFADRTWTGGFAWGPLFVGPLYLVRFGGAPCAELVQRLEQWVASPLPATEVETRAVELGRETGGSIVVPRAGATLELSHRWVKLRDAHREEHIKLRARDIARLSRFLADHQPASPWR